MNHSPEPWKVEPSDEHEGRFEIDHCANGSVTGCDGLFEIDARRIVACVNACKGVSTKVLEGGNGSIIFDELLFGTDRTRPPSAGQDG